ncbi:sigma-54 dependent transcriptional regulator/response regulator [Sulfurihydrogenibium azorense Az-Fu1]|uniref:Sigma-54 dependent transcriptional regulator/response regulator n=1 Tax=Sulfurihydrogenibium azorense (strain DSM 15241 / OCM 825 / Az-Fu1) TaxID=204536 RepID=C1DWZ5_SULAA|nr:sigma-54 dependent transcriptional regulator [Sulfurihydrogenibium azorense]ACN99180.1 sigma-54 dependent transcriptional regulator/response regulator [Sulfurihydrogenibium azorense Az-Fu1]
MFKVLLIDDEESILKIIKTVLTKEGYEVDTAKSKSEALTKLTTNIYNLILSDYLLEDGTGIEILEDFRKKDSITPFIIITAYGSINGAVEAVKKGANHYIPKPIDTDNLIKLIQFYKEKQSNPFEVEEFEGIIGKSKKMKELFNEIEIVSKSESYILIEGESGTGKELVAKAIHKRSRRANNPFVPINCSAIPSELFENELFGHEKGAYTGAASREIGKIELAGEGTLFLDEIGEMPLFMQAKLLRVLQEKEFYRVGGTSLIKMRCRVISATNRNLEQMVENKEFREDLFYRINVIHLKIPPLRERKEDIPLLVKRFIEKFSKINNKNIYDIDNEALEILMEYDWPGNVRQLENIIERTVVLCQGEIITSQHLPQRIKEKPLVSKINLEKSLNLYEIEKNIILKVLQEENFNQTKAAQRLGISRKQLRTKMKNFGLL